MTDRAGAASGPRFPADIELVSNDVRWVSLTFAVSLYTNVLFSSIPEAVLSCYEKFLELCPPENLKFYATENMKRHKEVTARAQNMLKTWLKPGAPPRPYIMLELKDGPSYNSAPKYRFEVWGSEVGSPSYVSKHANLIHLAFPPEWGVERTQDIFNLVVDLCRGFPLQSGHAGFMFHCSQYRERESQNHAWAKSMRYRGIDIYAHPNDKKAVGHDGIKGVGWLTMLCQPFLEQLGGLQDIRKALPSEVEIISVGSVSILKAGPKPEIGDMNRRDFLPLYKAVYKVVKPLIEKTFGRSPALMAGEIPDFEMNTQAWRRRFDDG